MSIGRRLQHAREMRDMTRLATARAAKLSDLTLKQMERMDRGSARSYDLAAKALNINPGWLRYGDPEYVVAHKAMELLFALEDTGHVADLRGTVGQYGNLSARWTEIKTLWEEHQAGLPEEAEE
jgi:transcriptional regulator with XRE-family HTH domain